MKSLGILLMLCALMSASWGCRHGLPKETQDESYLENVQAEEDDSHDEGWRGQE